MRDPSHEQVLAALVPVLESGRLYLAARDATVQVG
jgi:hypothetical protein